MSDEPASGGANRVFEVSTEDGTRQLGMAIGGAAEPGLVVALVGNLGAGKTRLVQAAAQGLGVVGVPVNSPTFVLIHEYQGRLPVYHFDTYRLRDIDEFLELGADEYMAGEGVCFVEWADRMEEVLPRDRLTVTFEITGERSRRIEIAAGGPRSLRVLDRLRTGGALEGQS